MKSYIVKEREDGTRYFDENTPAGNINPDVVGTGLEYSEGKLSVDAAELAGAGLTDDNGQLKVDSASIENVVHLDGAENITGAKTFTTSPAVPTVADSSDSTTKAASTAFVQGAIAANDANVVHKTGAEEVGGTKTFTTSPLVHANNPSLILYNNETKGSLPSTNRSCSVYLSDKDGASGAAANRLAGLICGLNTAGRTDARLYAYKNAAGSAVNSYMGIFYPQDGDPYTYAPHPPLNDSTTKIATTKWVHDVFPVSNGFSLKSDGTIAVDFSQIDEDTKNALRKELAVPIPLTGALTMYVNIDTGSDVIDDTRGLSADKPFKTVQACYDYVANTYNLQKNNVTISVASGTYGPLSCGSYTTTTGIISIVGDAANKPKIRAAGRAGMSAYAAGAPSVRVTIRNIDFETEITPSGTYTSSPNWLGINMQHASSEVYLYDCTISVVVNGSYTGTGTATIAAINANAGFVRCERCNTIVVNVADKTKTNAAVMRVGTEGRISWAGGTTDESSTCNITAVNVATFVGVGRGYWNYTQPSGYKLPRFSGDAIGAKKYSVSNGGHISVPANMGGVDYFPGTIAGTVEAETYSWYK